MRTFLAPAARWPFAFSESVKRPVDSMMYGVAADDQHVVVRLAGVALSGLDRVLESPLDRVVLHLVREVVGVRGDVDHTDDVDLLAEEALIAQGLEDQAADAAETIDSNTDRHRQAPL
jgi:hypothetical protein